MKKVVQTILIVVSIALFIFGISMEVRFSGSEYRKEPRTQESILEEMPDIKISEEDISLKETVLALGEIKDFYGCSAGNGFDVYEFPDDKAETMLEEWIKPGSILDEFSIIGSTVNLSFLHGQKKTDYTFSLEDPSSIYKMIALMEDDSYGTTCNTLYINHNGKIEKLTSRHLWLSWLRM